MISKGGVGGRNWSPGIPSPCRVPGARKDPPFPASICLPSSAPHMAQE